MQLYQYQLEHLHRLIAILQKYKIAIDSSVTGSGKTIVAVKLAETISLPVIIICPPTLIDHWKSYIVERENWTIVSSYSLKSLKPNYEFLLIVDECHLFKNTVKRTGELKRIQQKSRYTLMLSATPYDDTRQFSNIREIFGIQNDIKEQLSQMNFGYSTIVKFSYYHINMNEECDRLYRSGYISVNQSIKIENNNPTFKPELFTYGIHMIHNSLIQGAIAYIKFLINTEPTNKFIIVLNFMEHFDELSDAMTNVLILNGTTPMKERKQVIEMFQQDNLDYRIICISGEVGSVGIELDDKTGKYPRHMIVLPMTNAINFCQAIGRIQRTRTKSNSKVTVIQPIRHSTYFKNQISRKFKVLEQFMAIPKFKNYIEKHKCLIEIEKIFPSDFQSNIRSDIFHSICENIMEFFCDCI